MESQRRLQRSDFFFFLDFGQAPVTFRQHAPDCQHSDPRLIKDKPFPHGRISNESGEQGPHAPVRAGKADISEVVAEGWSTNP